MVQIRRRNQHTLGGFGELIGGARNQLHDSAIRGAPEEPAIGRHDAVSVPPDGIVKKCILR